MSVDSDVLIVGAGMSGLGMACQLIREFKMRNFEIIEKSTNVGGTWLQNTYPGCGCDVASHFYSYSFEPHADWTQKFAMQPEIQAYFASVADKYNITPHIRYGHAVDSANWDAKAMCWRVAVRNVKSGETSMRSARALVTAVGALSVPKPLDLPGTETFEGSMFHSQTWDHSFDWKGKRIIVLGNGCSATQFVPIMSAGTGAAASITQFVRSTHYLQERPNPTYSKIFKDVMRYVPLAQVLYRFTLYAAMERDFTGLQVDAGTPVRDDLKQQNEAYVRQMAPPRYWDFLMPKYMIGCKRKVMDTGYLECLWRDNVTLIHDDPVVAITETGVLTQSGRALAADAIILAIGFATHRMLWPMAVRGDHGTTLTEHWDAAHAGAPQAYLGTCVPGFPNLFLLNGPNTITGHLSVIYTVECQIGFALRLLAPVLRRAAAAVRVTGAAARRDSDWIQEASRRMVWSAGGCANWFLHPANGMQIMMYPDWQFMFWWRSVFVRAGDFEYTDAEGGLVRPRRALAPLVAGAVVGAACLGAWLVVDRPAERMRDVTAQITRALRIR